MNLLRSAALVSAMTLLSRITGLIREVVTAKVLGAGTESDAFFVAFRIPNLLRRLFAEGAFSQAFIPILAEAYGQEGRQKAVYLAQQVSVLLFFILIVLVVLGVLGSSYVVMGMASGFEPGSFQFNLTAQLTQWMFPYILLIAMVALASGLLNTFNHFSLPAFAPVLLNVAFILGTLFLAPYFEYPVQAMAFSVMLGGLAQVGLLWLGLWKANALLNPFKGLFKIRDTFRDSRVKRILKNMVPASLAVSVAQVSLIINTNIASYLQKGSVSWISFGDRIMEFPTALLGVALGTVLLPSLSRAAQQDTSEYSDLLDWGLKLTIVLALPAAVGLGVFSDALVAVLFNYGRFDAFDVQMTSQAVMAYSVGLCGLVLVKILAPGFYAKQDIKTPVKIAIFVVFFTQFMNLFFVPWLGHAGLPLSVGLGATMNAFILYIGLRRKSLYKPGSGWLLMWLRVLVAALAMGTALYFANQQFDWVLMGADTMQRVFWLALVLMGACCVYFLMLLILGLRLGDLMRKPQPQRN